MGMISCLKAKYSKQLHNENSNKGFVFKTQELLKQTTMLHFHLQNGN